MRCSNSALQIETRSNLKRNRRFAFQRARTLSLLALASLTMTGCARGVTETTVAPTGTRPRRSPQPQRG